ncbi:MAG: Peptidoglycan glycosyltransferase [Clostridia bacterium]|jgi:membrane peptidoglycan carboxypeptidase|nr:Peptidoglycan glycosyltransferase [Clostridia bacterium]
MKRYFIGMTKALGMIGLLIIFGITGIGYYRYQQLMEANPIETKIMGIRKSANYTPFQQINDTFLKAIVAVEDRRFYQHGGMDGIAIVRAMLNNILKGKIVQGGSTITQQLAKNLYLTQEKTMMRKIQEMFIANTLENYYSKDEILELYVNVIYYGDGNSGIQMASQNYFNKTPKALTYHEATLLAGVPQSPTRYSLSKHYSRATERQKIVIAMLQKQAEKTVLGYTD